MVLVRTRAARRKADVVRPALARLKESCPFTIGLAEAVRIWGRHFCKSHPSRYSCRFRQTFESAVDGFVYTCSDYWSCTSYQPWQGRGCVYAIRLCSRPRIRGAYRDLEQCLIISHYRRAKIEFIRTESSKIIMKVT